MHSLLSLVVTSKPLVAYDYSKNANWLSVCSDRGTNLRAWWDGFARISWIQQPHMLILSPLTPYLLHHAAQRHAHCFKRWQKLGSWILTILIVKSLQWGMFLRIWGLLPSWGDFPIAQTHAHTHTHTHTHTDTHIRIWRKSAGRVGGVGYQLTVCVCESVCRGESEMGEQVFPTPTFSL